MWMHRAEIVGESYRSFNMLYVLFGNDSAKCRSKLTTLVHSLLAKKPDAMVLRSDADRFNEADVLDYCESQGLFEQKSIIVLDALFENSAHRDYILQHLEDMNPALRKFMAK